jgi:hypothetical protein
LKLLFFPQMQLNKIYGIHSWFFYVEQNLKSNFSVFQKEIKLRFSITHFEVPPTIELYNLKRPSFHRSLMLKRNLATIAWKPELVKCIYSKMVSYSWSWILYFCFSVLKVYLRVIQTVFDPSWIQSKLGEDLIESQNSQLGSCQMWRFK